jgi:alkanesulfonate monooxygenase SsuD/methylene tetrahydromethanopterin reductase-like flavin-dependent oxidoreductase (luciferase family)
MRKGFVVPYADSREFADLATLAEEHGWDGIFTWEALWGVDAWVSLAAAAMQTERIRLGTLLTPAARFKPWDLTSRVSTVDRLSNGRVTLSVGLGAVHAHWLAFEQDEGRKTRAEKLDECLAIYAGLTNGQPFAFEGKHYVARPTDFFLPDPPVQRPHPPVWVVGVYFRDKSRQRSLERSARWNGLLPQVAEGGERMKPSPERLAEAVEVVRQLRADAGVEMDGYDVIVEGDTVGGWVEHVAPLSEWEAAGGTWWIESWWNVERGPDGLAEVRRRIAAGPPA